MPGAERGRLWSGARSPSVNVAWTPAVCARHNRLSPLPQGGEHVKESRMFFQAFRCSRQRRRYEVTVPLLRRIGYSPGFGQRVCTAAVRGQAEAAIDEQIFGTFTQDLA